MIRLLHPEWLWALPVLLLLVIPLRRKTKMPALLFPNTEVAARIGKSKHSNPFHWLVELRFLALICLIIALARPQLGRSQPEISAKGIDIILALDVSTSMDALDFKLKSREIRRVEAVKVAIERFVKDRTDDRLALLVFAAKPYLLSPLTLDHDYLLDRLYTIDTGIIEDGTAIGTALARSVRQLNDREAISKVVILLTDGENNRGRITPKQAAEVANTLNTKIYTIGAGTRGKARIKTQNAFGRTVYQTIPVNIDEDTLTEIANTTGGQYFRATDLNELEAIYDTIDDMEKTTRKVQGFSVEQELFPLFLSLALLLIVIEVLLSQTLFLKIP